MALTKTVTYTPFNKTSFGFATGDLTGPHSAKTHVKVTIQSVLNTHWNVNGHISTPTSGSAGSSYSKSGADTGTNGPLWSCQGSLADVAGVLDTLEFFPADFPAVRTWELKKLKPNQTSGTFPVVDGIGEEPGDTATTTIPDTVFTLIVYDIGDGTATPSSPTTYTVTLDPTQPTFGKQRPFWSTEPTDEDMILVGTTNATGLIIDMGVISQDTDTDPLTVTCEFRKWQADSNGNRHEGTVYGQFSSSEDMFIGDKKPAATDNVHKRLNFTGTKSEVQAYLDSVKFWQPTANFQTFDMFLTLSNGAVGSTVTKSCWDSGSVIGVNDLTGDIFSFTEDQSVVTPAPFDFGDLDITNVQDDVDGYSAIITLDSTGIAGTDTIASTVLGSAGTTDYNGTTGVLTITNDTLFNLKTALQNITYTPNQDFNTDFTMSFQLSFTGSALTSTYTSTLQTGIVVEGEETEDLRNQNTIHNYIEEHGYNFSSETVPKITHPINENFTVTFTMTAQAGFLGIFSPTATFTDVGNGVFTLAGTKDKVNADLTNLFYKPKVDYFADHTINFTVLRTSGGGSPPTLTGSFEMKGTDVGEFTNTQLIDVGWEEDTNLTFDNGIQIIDTADEYVDQLSFSTHYTVYCEMWGPGAGTVPVFTDATLKIDNTGRSITTTIAGAFVVGNQYTILTINDGLTPAGDDTVFTDIGAADNNIGTIFTATGVGSGTGTATGDSLTITGNGQGMTNVFAISGPKVAVNTAIKNIKFIPDPDYDGVGPWIWYYIKRDFDDTFITNVGALMPGPSGPQVYSYDLSLITKFLPASSTVDYFPTAVVLDWEENVTKVFDSGLEINDKVTENPEYNTSPTAFYGTTYTVDVAMYVSGTATEYSNATIDTVTKGSLVISGTGRGDTDKFIMTGSRAELNAALKTMKFIPNVDNVETTNQTTLLYRIKRDYDYNASTGVGLLLDQAQDIKTVFNINTATTNTTSTPLTDIDWNEDEIKDFDSGIVITDNATSNPDYGNLYNTTFTVTARAKYTDTSSVTQPMNNATWDTTWDGNDIGYSVSGVGTVADPLTITGTKADVNTALANLRMAGDLDWIDSDASDDTFWFEYKLTREVDSLTYIDYDTGESEFNGGTATDPYHSTVSPDDMAYNENIVSKIFEGKTLGIRETATDIRTDIKYQVELEISPNTDGTWGSTGNSIYTTPKTTCLIVNAEILALDFTPKLDYFINPTIKYTQRRYQNVTAGSFVVDTVYTILTPGNTNFTLIGAADSVAGTTFTATGVGSGTGTADIVTVQATDVNIGTVTGTAVVPYVASVSGMTFVENNPTSIFSGKTVGITEDVSVYTPDATYDVELKISPTSHAEWDYDTIISLRTTLGGASTTTGGHTVTWTGNKYLVNAVIQQLVVNPLADGFNVTSGAFVIGNKYTILTPGNTNFTLIGAADSNVDTVFTATGVGSGTGTAKESIDFDIKYSQTRHLETLNFGSGSLTDVQATDVNIGTAVGEDQPDIIYGTANQNIQYFVPHEHINGVDMSPLNYGKYRPGPQTVKTIAPRPLVKDHQLMPPTGSVEIFNTEYFAPEDVILTPRQLSLNLGLPYERPFTIVENNSTVGAQYKVVFSGGTMETIANYTSLNVMDTNWGTVDDIHRVIENGLYPVGPTTSWFPHKSTFTFNFTLYKKTSNGVVTTATIGQLTYSFLTGIDAYHIKPETWRLNELPYGTWLDEDKIESTESIDFNVYDQRNTGKWGDRLIFFPTNVTSSNFSDDVLENATNVNGVVNGMSEMGYWGDNKNRHFFHPRANQEPNSITGNQYFADPNSNSYGRSFASMGMEQYALYGYPGWKPASVGPWIFVGLVSDIDNTTGPGTSVQYSEYAHSGMGTWENIIIDGEERETNFAFTDANHGKLNYIYGNSINVARQPFYDHISDRSWSHTIPYGPYDETFPRVITDHSGDIEFSISPSGDSRRIHKMTDQVNIVPILTGKKNASAGSFQSGIERKFVVTAIMDYGVILKLGYDWNNNPLTFKS
jgi:hypothetical protein